MYSWLTPLFSELVDWWAGELVDWWAGELVDWWAGELVDWWAGGIVGCIPVHKRVQAPMVPGFKQPPGLRPGLPGFGPGLAGAFRAGSKGSYIIAPLGR